MVEVEEGAMQLKQRYIWQPFSLVGLALLACFAFDQKQAFADPLQGGIQEQGYLQTPTPGTTYPSPQMTGPMQGQVSGGMPLNRQIDMMPRHQGPTPSFRAGAAHVALPPPFLGAWAVQGQRSQINAKPEFQAAADQAFAGATNNTWQINGNPQTGYSMASNTGIQTQLIVDKVENNTAYMRYQHPIGNTTAQEEIVMTLLPGGMQFRGLERISIVKQGGPPRATVTYQLYGQRQQ